MPRYLIALLVAVVLLPALAGCAHSPPTDPWDPIEPVNRKVHAFNMTLDDYILRPAAKGYHKVTPDPVETSVGNFFSNIHEPITIVNSLLQLKWASFNIALGRLLINTTAGVGGLFDVATAIGVEQPDEDLGQTLGYWGVGRGAYLVLPFFGPSNGRDLIGSVGDAFANPINYIDSLALRLSLHGLYILNKRASFLSFDQVLEQQFDPYIFIRSYYLKTRQALVHDNEGDEPDYDEQAATNMTGPP